MNLTCFPVLQVLVVWDVSVGKARNYRLFEEVRVFMHLHDKTPVIQYSIQK